MDYLCYINMWVWNVWRVYMVGLFDINKWGWEIYIYDVIDLLIVYVNGVESLFLSMIWDK